MLYCLIGRTGCGKDTVARILNEGFGMKQVCSYTTRPKCETETEGVEHKFITEEQADKLLSFNDKVVAKTRIGEYRYFALIDDVMDADIYVIDPKGIECLESKFPDLELFKVYVKTDKDVQIARARKRGDNIEVLQKRMDAESEQFDNFLNYDLTIENNSSFDDLRKQVISTFKNIHHIHRGEDGGLYEGKIW